MTLLTTTLLATLLFTWAGVINVVLWILLVFTMLLLIAVILLQEGKGGGLAEAFGGAGAETFGVKAHGINKFTAGVGTAFLLICVLLVNLRPGPDTRPLTDRPATGPVIPGMPDGLIPPPSTPVEQSPPAAPPAAPPGNGAGGGGGEQKPEDRN